MTTLILGVAVMAYANPWTYGKWKVMTQPVKELLPASLGPDPTKDPQIGMVLQSRALATIAPGRAGYFVTCVGDCTSCMRADLVDWSHSATAAGLRMVVVVVPSTQHPDILVKLKKACSIIQDTGHVVHDRLNAVWPARSYLFSRDWRLKWLSTNPLQWVDPFTDMKFLEAKVSMKGGPH